MTARASCRRRGASVLPFRRPAARRCACRRREPPAPRLAPPVRSRRSCAGRRCRSLAGALAGCSRRRAFALAERARSTATGRARRGLGRAGARAAASARTCSRLALAEVDGPARGATLGRGGDASTSGCPTGCGSRSSRSAPAALLRAAGRALLPRRDGSRRSRPSTPPRGAADLLLVVGAGRPRSRPLRRRLRRRRRARRRRAATGRDALRGRGARRRGLPRLASAALPFPLLVRAGGSLRAAHGAARRAAARARAPLPALDAVDLRFATLVVRSWSPAERAAARGALRRSTEVRSEHGQSRNSTS